MRNWPRPSWWRTRRRLLYRPIATRYEGYADLHAPLEARKYLKQFADIWEEGRAGPGIPAAGDIR